MDWHRRDLSALFAEGIQRLAHTIVPETHLGSAWETAWKEKARRSGPSPFSHRKHQRAVTPTSTATLVPDHGNGEAWIGPGGNEPLTILRNKGLSSTRHSQPSSLEGFSLTAEQPLPRDHPPVAVGGTPKMSRATAPWMRRDAVASEGLSMSAQRKGPPRRAEVAMICWATQSSRRQARSTKSQSMHPGHERGCGHAPRLFAAAQLFSLTFR